MAIFTATNKETLTPWLLKNYNLELVAEPEAITEGIENTNYRITTKDNQQFVFTVIEVWDQDLANYCLTLSRFLHDQMQPVPGTLRNINNKNLYSIYENKPAAVVEFVQGHSIRNPDVNNCEKAGNMLAKLHLAVSNFPLNVNNPRGFKWRKDNYALAANSLQQDDRKLIEAASNIDAEMQKVNFVQGASHCDLFRNNVLWNNGDISGVIDFYFAGSDFFSFDLGVAVVDWTMDDIGVIDQDKLSAFMQGYQEVRKLPAIENKNFANMMVVACLRFWMSRIIDILQPRDAIELNAHDPNDFRNRLQACLDSQEIINSCIIK